MGYMVPAVPGVHGDSLLYLENTAMLGMSKPPFEVGRAQLTKQQQPALVQRLEQRKRRLDRSGARVRQLGPTRLLVRLDGGLLFRERELDPGVCVKVAVGKMMHHLPQGPAGGPVRGVELLRRQAGHGLTQVAWSSGDFTDPPLSRAWVHVSVEPK